MAGRLSFDTNALIYFLNRTRPYCDLVDEFIEPITAGRKGAVLSVVTEIELMVKPFRESDILQLARIQTMLGGPAIQVMEVDRVLARTAAEMRARHGLSLTDATIVATAMHANCDVLIGNDERCARRVREIPYALLDDLVKETP